MVNVGTQTRNPTKEVEIQWAGKRKKKVFPVYIYKLSILILNYKVKIYLSHLIEELYIKDNF